MSLVPEDTICRVGYNLSTREPRGLEPAWFYAGNQ